jgi:hypothetical protein
MPELKIYYDNKYNEHLQSFNLQPIIDFAPPEFKIENYWKLEYNYSKVNENNLIEYGEYILKLVENYQIVEPIINFILLIFIERPSNFNGKLFIIYLYNKDYKGLLRYINDYLLLEKNLEVSNNVEVSNNTEISNNTEVSNNIEVSNNSEVSNNADKYLYFNNFLKDTKIILEEHINNPYFYNKELNNYITKENLDEIKSFGYFNLKYGDSGRYGIWVKN